MVNIGRNGERAAQQREQMRAQREVIIIFNKSDILSEEELHYEKMMCTLYETIRRWHASTTTRRVPSL